MNETQKKLMDDIDSGHIQTVSLDHKFKFDCTSCGRCCFKNDILLNSYDMIRLRHALGKTTDQILKDKYLELYIGGMSGLPIAKIRFQPYANDITKCPFLLPAFDINNVLAHLKEASGGDDKKYKEMAETYKKDPSKFGEALEGIKIDKWLCSIHEDRPLVCRIFPCGRIQKIDKDTFDLEEKYVLQDTEEDREFCPGWESDVEMTVEEYLTAQYFWHAREGSARFTDILNLLGKNGFIAKTEHNENNDPKPLLEQDSMEINVLGNILYNFDAIPPFNNDPRVKATITDRDASQADFLYVMDRIVSAITGFIDGIKLAKEKEVEKNNDKTNKN